MEKKKVKRFLGAKESEFVVVGLATMKTDIDSFTGSISHNMICRVGSIDQPVDFLPFFEQTENERNLLTA